VDAANHVALDWVKRTLGNQLSDPEVVAGDLPIALVHQHA
jgi:hypothetical protein